MKAALISALNGVLGDYLRDTDNPLAIELGFFRNGQPLDHLLDKGVEAFPDWDGTVCVFLHGAAASETVWENDDHDHNYTSLVYDEVKALPALVRYNSGLHISENGRALTGLFEEQLGTPAVRRVIIVGHSMGGLLFRSACHYAWKKGHKWPDKVGQVFYLGSPHLGAPLEKFGAWAQALLSRIETPYTRTAAKLIDIRSNGIKDLRLGYLTDEEWQEDDKYDHPVNAKLPSKHVYHLGNARHYLVAGTIHADPDSVLADWFGDVMVRKSSAIAACRQNLFHLPVDEDDILIVGGHHHVKLLASEAVYHFMRRKLRGYH
jgi:pimeloyl-ACP methyl ester carboxylesterase